MRIIDGALCDDAAMGTGQLWHSYGTSESPACAVRPVVTIPSSAALTKVDGVWQIEL